jgi:hypothetical protein
MEFVWMIPLYLIIPVTGIILLFLGFNADKGQSRRRIGFGLILLSLPLLHAFLVSRSDTNNEKSLIGNYTLDSTEQVVLRLNPDYTFEFAKIDSVPNFGRGKWKYHRWDIEQLDLFFSDSSQADFHIVREGKRKFLQNNFWTEQDINMLS